MTDIELLYKDCHQRMLTVARLMLKNDDEASDTVSDVFARLAEGSLKMPDDHPDRYLMVIVRNRCLDRIRVMTLRERIERRLSLSDTEPAFGEREQDKQTWNVFQLRFDEGLLYREIAKRLGISEVSVHKHLAEALRLLKEKFNPTRR